MNKYKRPTKWLNKDSVISILRKRKIILLNPEKYETTRDILDVKCIRCGFTWTKQIKKLLYRSSRRHHRPCGCPHCKLVNFHNTIKKNQIRNFSRYGDFKSYSRKARYLTKILNKKYKWFKNGKKFHIDHIVSIRDCFRNNIPLFISCSKVNLRIISCKRNKIKHMKSNMTINELIHKFKKYNKGKIEL